MAKRTLTRRDFLKFAGAAVGAVAAQVVPGRLLLPRAPSPPLQLCSQNAPSEFLFRAGDERPNIIVVLLDDQRWDHMSCMGHPFLQTPNMDRLVQEGALFNNAFVTTSLCSPSRASFLTGLYAHAHGVKNNLTPWDNRNVTFMEYLHDAGYRNAFIGKWHMPGRLPELRGVDRFITFTVKGGQGQYFDCPLIIDGVETQRPGTYITEDLTSFALEFIRAEKEGPFCLYLSHKAAHQNFLPPPELDHLYDNEDLSFLPPESFPWQTWTPGAYWEGALGSMHNHYRDYCEALVAVDQQLGRLLDELDVLGLRENTIVVYTSDNGYSWGEHIRNGKRWATEENLRIPFLLRYPARLTAGGLRPDPMVLNIDLAPTLLDLAGLPVPESMQGRSILPVMENRAQDWRTSFLYEYFKDFPYNVPAQNAVRTRQYLYVEYDGRRLPELYDIQRDPRTLQNIIDSPSGRQQLPELKKLLDEYLAARPEEKS